MITDSVIAYLTANAGVKAIVGTNIWPDIASRTAALPCLVLQQTSLVHGKTLSGDSGSDVAHYTIHCYATMYSAAEALGRAVDAAINGYSGPMGSVTAQECWTIDARDGIYVAQQVGEQREYWKQVDISIRFGS